MPKPQFCSTCIFYEKDIFTRVGDSFGICHNPSVAIKVGIDGKSHMEEDGTFYTERYFGCIYWRETGGTLISINEIVNKDIIKAKAEEFIDKYMSKYESVICKNCGAENCENNITCIKCNCQL